MILEQEIDEKTLENIIFLIGKKNALKLVECSDKEKITLYLEGVIYKLPEKAIKRLVEMAQEEEPKLEPAT